MSVTKTKNPDGTFGIKITCDKCGEPLTIVNEHGMFCKNKCGLKESIEAKKIADSFINEFIKKYPPEIKS